MPRLLVALGVLPPCSVAVVDDTLATGLDPPAPRLDADWVARLDDGSILPLEWQGYRDKAFRKRLFDYHRRGGPHEAQGEAHGRAPGEAHARLASARLLVSDLAELLAIDVDEEKRTFVANAPLDELDALRVALKRDRVWPKGGVLRDDASVRRP